MILEIESAYGDTVIHGKRIDENELRANVKYIISLVGEREFASAFCTRFGYEPVLCAENVKVDFTIDLDTHQIFKSKY